MAPGALCDEVAGPACRAKQTRNSCGRNEGGLRPDLFRISDEVSGQPQRGEIPIWRSAMPQSLLLLKRHEFDFDEPHVWD